MSGETVWVVNCDCGRWEVVEWNVIKREGSRVYLAGGGQVRKTLYDDEVYATKGEALDALYEQAKSELGRIKTFYERRRNDLALIANERAGHATGETS